MHRKELMMTIIGSSTALAGLTAIVIGQMVQSNLSEYVLGAFKIPLIVTFLLALSTVALAMCWFDAENETVANIALWVFVLQLFLFMISVFGFWYNLLF